MAQKILLIEDEAPIREMTRFVLEQKDYQVLEADDYSSGITACSQEPFPDLILLDWMLPGGAGIDLMKQIKFNEFSRQIPIIMLTAKGEEDDKVRALEAGADDYITKPFSPSELLARVKAVLRRANPRHSEECLEVDGLLLDPVSHRVKIDQQTIDMGPTEYNLLHFFMTHQERVYSREQLLNNVWGTNVYVEDRTVDVHIRRLRKVLSARGHDELIQTVRGAGYRFSTH